MSMKELKIGDIAHLTGISEQDVRALVRTYDSLFTYRTIGPVRLYPENAVGIVRELADLSGRGLAPHEIVEEVRSGRRSVAPEEPAEEVERAAAPLPPEVVIDLAVMRDMLARQERRIVRLADDLERERELRMAEVARLRETVDDLQERLRAQRGELTLVAEWVDYFDRRMDDLTRPVLERVRRAFGKENEPREPSGRSG